MNEIKIVLSFFFQILFMSKLIFSDLTFDFLLSRIPISILSGREITFSNSVCANGVKRAIDFSLESGFNL